MQVEYYTLHNNEILIVPYIITNIDEASHLIYLENKLPIYTEV